MIKFTDEFIKEANYLYRLADEFSDLSTNYLDELEDRLFIKRLDDIFKSKFNQAVDYLGDGYHRSRLIPALKNYLIGLSCLNNDLAVSEFLDGINLD